MNAQASKDTAATTTIVKPPYMQNRELSWLDFNKRVLDQGADPTVPLLERLNFISIFWSNLQEFFMVRVGSLTDLSLLKKSIIDPKSGMTPAQQLDAIYARCHELYPYYEETYKTVRSLLAEQGIRGLHKEDLTAEQRDYLRGYMEDNVLPFLSPQIINARHPFPHLENGGLYIVVRLDEEARPKAKKSKEERARDKAEAKATKNLGAEGVTLGIIPLPRQTSRVIELPGDGLQFILVERAIEMVRRRGLLDVHRQAHQHHLRDPQRRFGCHGRRRRAGRGLPRAHEAHPEEAQPPGAGAPGKRAAALAHGEGASAGEVGPGRAPAVRHPRAAEHGLAPGGWAVVCPPRRAPRSPRRRSRLSGPPASIASAPSSSR